jgi:iron(III) transport system permease protein
MSRGVGIREQLQAPQAFAARRGRWIHVRGDPWPGLFLAIVVVASAIIVTILAIVIWLSFRDAGSDGQQHYSLAQYATTFLDPFTYRVLLNTLGFAATTLVVALAFGVPLAWLIERTDFPGKTLLFTVMAIGLTIPGFASAMGWLFLLHPRIGLLNAWLRQSLGLTASPFDIGTVIGMGWVQGLDLAPVAFILSAAVFRAADPLLEQAAQIAGARFDQIVRRIILPLAWPGILAAGLYVFTIGFSAFDVPAIIGWGSRLFTFSSYLVLQLNPNNGLPNYGAVAALSTVLIALAGALSWWYGRMQQRAHRYQVVRGKAYRPKLQELGAYKYLAWLFAGFYLCASKLVPLALLAWASVLPYFQLPTAAAWATVSMKRYNDLPWGIIRESVLNTGVLMLLVPTMTLLISISFSWIVLRSRLRARRIFDLIAFLPHAVPSIVFGVGALLLTLYLVQPVLPILGTLWILLAVFIVARTSYATRMTNSGLIQIHRELEESAQVSGASTGIVLGRIVGPLLAPTALYAWLWLALLTVRELTLAVILTSRGNITLPVEIWNLWLGGGLGNAAALALMMVLLMMPLVAVYWIVARRQDLLTHV